MMHDKRQQKMSARLPISARSRGVMQSVLRQLFLCAVLLFPACSQERTDVIVVDSEDTEMNGAMAEARNTLEDFWAEREKQGEGFQGVLKVYFADRGEDLKGEHMWVRVTDYTPEEISGILLSTPGWLKSVREGDEVRFPYSRVSDWLYVEDGMARGAYTVKLLRSRMSPAERRSHDAAYSFRFE